MNDVDAAVTRFLFEESAALDDARYDEWLDLLAEDFKYHMPIPLSPESPFSPQYSNRTSFARESKGSMKLRFDRVASEYAWLERPRHFVRHFVSNIRVYEGDEPGELTVHSNVLVSRFRSSEPHTLTSAARQDTLREVAGGGFLLAQRTVLLDLEVPHASQLVAVF